MPASGQLIDLLRTDQDAICAAWMERLSDTAKLAGQRLELGSGNPSRAVMFDLMNILEGRTARANGAVRSVLPVVDWNINLTHAVEIIFTGEVVVRGWAYAHLDLTEREQVEMFEKLNRAFHELLRAYTLQYCQTCSQRKAE